MAITPRLRIVPTARDITRERLLACNHPSIFGSRSTEFNGRNLHTIRSIRGRDRITRVHGNRNNRISNGENRRNRILNWENRPRSRSTMIRGSRG